MPVYVYETMAGRGRSRRYEIRQSIHEDALARHPETGEPIRRVITGGLGALTKPRSGMREVPMARGGGCCGGGGCGCSCGS